jgi:hypothetical protein
MFSLSYEPGIAGRRLGGVIVDVHVVDVQEDLPPVGLAPPDVNLLARNRGGLAAGRIADGSLEGAGDAHRPIIALDPT